MAGDLGRLMATMGVDLGPFRRGMSQAEGVMKRSGRSMRRMGKQMSMAVSLPLAIMGGAAIKTFADFESAMNQVKAVSGATGDEFSKLEGIARELGSTTKFTATQAAEGMNFLAMAGFEVNEVMDALPATLNLAAAGNMQLGESADIVSNIMQGFQIEAARTNEVADILTKTFTSSNTSLQQLGDAMSYVAPVAKGFGQDIKMTSAAVGILSDAGIQASKAGTGLRRVLSILAKKSEEVGVEVFDASGSMRSLADILADLEKQGMSSARIMDVFGMRGGPVMQVLLARGSDALREFTGELDNAGGTAERVAETQMQGLKGAWTELRSALSELMISFVKPFAGMLTDLVDKVKGVTQWFGDLNERTRRTIVVIAGITAAIGPLLLVLGVLVGNVIPGLIHGFRVLTGVMMANPWMAVIAGAAALVPIITSLVGKTNDLTKGEKALNDVRETATERIANQRAEVENLYKIAQNENNSLQARKGALDKLNDVSEEYFGNLNMETINTEKATEAKEAYIDSLLKEAKVKAGQEKLQQLEKERLETLEETADLGYWEKLSVGLKSYFDKSKDVVGWEEKIRENQAEVNEEYDKARGKVADLMKELMGDKAFGEWRTLGDIMDDMGSKLDKAKDMNEALGDSFDLNNRKAAIYRSTIKELIDKGLDPESNAVKEVRAKLVALQDAEEDTGGSTNRMTESMEKATLQMHAMQNTSQQTAEQLAASLGDINMTAKSIDDIRVTSEGASFGVDFLGRAFQGMQNSITNAMENSKNVLQGFWTFFKDFITGLIAKLIAATVVTVLLALALSALPGMGGAGGMISAMKNAGEMLGTSGIAEGLVGLQEGTPEVTKSGSFVVGEKEPEIVNLNRGDSVTPMSQAGNINIQPKMIEVGDKLYFLFKEQERRKGNTYGS